MQKFNVWVRSSACDSWHWESCWNDYNDASEWAWNHAGRFYGHNNVKIEIKAETA